MKPVIQIALLLLSVFSLTACPHGKGKSKGGPGVKRVKGDPAIMIRGTLQNGNQTLPLALVATSEWSLGAGGFQEEAAATDVNEVLETQKPSAKVKDSENYAVTRLVGDQWVASGMLDSKPIQIVFNREGQGIRARTLTLAGKTSNLDVGPIQVVHTSVTPTGDAFNLLLQNTTPGERAVMSLNFIRSQAPAKSFGNKIYEYMFGAGLKIGWIKTEPRVLYICGDIPSSLAQIPEREALKWSMALHGKLDFKTVRRKACPPFSDLNTQTYFYATDWIEILGDAKVSALTMSMSGAGSKNLLDADVVVLLGEFQEDLDNYSKGRNVMDPRVLNLPQLQAMLAGAALHEIGHLLGLHHQFNANYPSIMSYAKDRKTQLYGYDVEAIAHLYE